MPARSPEITHVVVAVEGIDENLLDIDDVEFDAVGRHVHIAVGVDVDVEIGIGIESRRDADIIVAPVEEIEPDPQGVAGRLAAFAAIDRVDAVANSILDGVVAAGALQIVVVEAAAQRVVALAGNDRVVAAHAADIEGAGRGRARRREFSAASVSVMVKSELVTLSMSPCCAFALRRRW